MQTENEPITAIARIEPDALHAGLAAIDLAVLRPADDSTLVIRAKCRALLVGYDHRWAQSDYIPVEVERTVQTDLLNPETGRKSRNLTTAGKLDVVAYSRATPGQLVLIDHKTTSDDITDPSSSYWRQLVVESQPSHYMLLKWQSGEKIDNACWDVMRKPSISPRQLKSKAERTLTIANGKYCGRPLTAETMDWLQTSDRENLEMYESRLIDDCCAVRPEWYFQRRSIPRLDAELLDYSRDLWDAAQLVIEARRLNRYPKHPASCMNYGRPCQFLGLCSGFDRPDSENWRRRTKVHAELEISDSRNVLTFSSIRTFQACPRKFFYRYEEGIERVDTEEAEALKFGHLWHTALESYWASMLPASESPAAPTSGATEPLDF